MLCAGALPPQSLHHEGEGGLEARQAGRAAAERAPDPGGTEAACGPPLWPREWGHLSALGLCYGGSQTGQRVHPGPQDPVFYIEAIDDMKRQQIAPETIDQSPF